MKSYYDILEISANASEEAIHSAYRVLTKKYTSAVSGNYDVIKVKLQEINQAYTVLSDPVNRKAYDAQLRDRVSQARAAEARTPPPKSSAQTVQPAKASSGGFLSRTFSTIFSLCICGLIVYGIVWVCQNGFEFIGSFVSEHQNAEEEKYPEDARYDAIVAGKLRQAEEAKDDNTRRELFLSALEMEVVEYVFKVMIYYHYTGEEAENKSFAKEQLAEITSTTDKMRNYFGDDEMGAIGYVLTNQYFDSFEERESEYEAILGKDWNKRNLDVNELWERLLQQYPVQGE